MKQELLLKDSGQIPQVNPRGEFGVVMNSVQPRSTLGKAVVTILAYSLETRRLDMEAERLRLLRYSYEQQADIAREGIKAEKEARLAEIELQRESMMKGLALYEKEIKNTHLTRRTLIKLINEMSQNITILVKKRNVDTKAVKELRKLLAQFSSQLVSIETQNHEKSLQQLTPLLKHIDNTREKLLSN